MIGSKKSGGSSVVVFILMIVILNIFDAGNMEGAGVVALLILLIGRNFVRQHMKNKGIGRNELFHQGEERLKKIAEDSARKKKDYHITHESITQKSHSERNAFRQYHEQVDASHEHGTTLDGVDLYSKKTNPFSLDGK